MPSLHTLLTVTLAGFLMSLSPGPSMLYVLSRSVGQSRAAGLASALGLAIGGVILAMVAASGLALIFERSTLLFQLVTTLGGLYIIYLGAQGLRELRAEPLNLELAQEREDETAGEQRGDEALLKIVSQGVLVELLNPKTVLFFVAFIPPFVDPSRGAVTGQLLILGLLVPLTALPSDLLIAFVGGSIAERLKAHQGQRQALKLLGSLILIGIGLSVFLSEA